MITVICGPPCSGKSTYVRTHAKPGDIVIDFDVIAQALGSPDHHDHSADIRKVAAQARRHAILAAMWVHEHTPVWIIDSKIPKDRMALYQANGASIVRVQADLDELHRRADAERPERWHQLIDRWREPADETPDAAPSRTW